jgi:hypothetical protein
MKRYIFFTTFLLIAMLSHATTNNESKYRFHLSGGYTIAWDTKGHQLKDLLSGTSDLPMFVPVDILYLHHFHLRGSLLNYDSENLFLFEPGLAFMTRASGYFVDYGWHCTSEGSYKRSFEQIDRLSYLDLFGKVKLNFYASSNNNKWLKVYPSLGITYSYLMSVQTKTVFNEYLHLNVRDTYNPLLDDSKKLYYNRQDSYLLAGVDFVFTNKYTIGAEYNSSLRKQPFYAVDLYYQSINLSLGVLF